jgi:cytochrome c-type biogenesis protein
MSPFLLPLFAVLAGVLSSSSPCCLPLLMRERRFDMTRLPKGTRGAFGVGVAFAAGWTPCIGPILALILATAASTGTVAWGALVLILYSLGLGLPFIALALGLDRARGSLAWVRRHGRQIEVTGGGLMAIPRR